MTHQDPRWLPESTLLHWYKIRSVLGQGGFGVTYLAHDENLQQNVAIKEYFPSGIAARDSTGTVSASAQNSDDYDYGLNRFLDEGRTLVKFDHPAIVRVTSVFEENGTAYLVMRYEQGQALSEILKEQGTIPEDDLLTMALALIEGLERVHAAGFIHRDIKPSNIYIRADGSPVLLDFGSARQALGNHTQTLTTMVSPGYAPYEQYVSEAAYQGPWTDIYALAATLYCAASGIPPMPALERGKAIMNDLGDYLVPLEELVGNKYSLNFMGAVTNALAFKESDRTRSLAEFRAELTGEAIAMLNTDKHDRTVDINAATRVNTDVTAPTSALPTNDDDTVTEVISNKNTSATSFKIIVYAVVFGLLFAITAGFLLAKWPTLTSSPKQEITTIPAQKSNHAESRSSNTIASLLEAASNDFNALRLTTPITDNAFEKFQAVLAIEPHNRAAKKGIRKIAVRYLELARDAGQNKRWDKMFEYLGKAREIAPNDKKIVSAGKRLRSLIEGR